MRKIGLATDHGGYQLKEWIKAQFAQQVEFVDYGTHSEASVDYPEVISTACKKLLSGEVESLIALCGTGIGASITANRFHGIRAALCHNEFTAEMSKKHNNANVLVLGARVLDQETAKLIVDKWLNTEFESGRHLNRIQMIETVSK
jgi:ribose 5-phosphate isomerase B